MTVPAFLLLKEDCQNCHCTDQMNRLNVLGNPVHYSIVFFTGNFVFFPRVVFQVQRYLDSDH